MRIAIGADHAGFQLKETVERELRINGWTVHDLGTHEDRSVDYPDFAESVARAVLDGEADFGVLVCATGIGMSIAANKVPGIRAALCTDTFTARRARAHNDANVLCLGAVVVDSELATEMVLAFLSTPFDGGRHARRIDKIAASERRGSAMPTRH